MSIRHENLLPSAVIEIGEPDAKPAQKASLRAEPRFHGAIAKAALTQIPIETVQLIVQVCDIEIGMSIAVEVRRINAHARFGLAVAIKPDTRGKPGFLKCP